MYYPNNIEERCYDKQHIEQVVTELRANFHDYFDKFIETESGNIISNDVFKKISEELGATDIKVIKKNKDRSKVYKQIINDSVESFNKDRQDYLNILDSESIEEYEDDPPSFKNTVLKNKCPIIRLTLQNKKAKELDKYRIEFRTSNPNDLLKVVSNLTNFANEYAEEIYNSETYEKIIDIDELQLSALDEDDYTVYGVIGGGIKSHLLFKLYPSFFPNRSREAIWALWYLTKKKTFGCIEDSEFLMINRRETITQQNYFYPYELFSFYAFNIYQLLKKEAEKLDVHIDSEYKYVIVDTFLSFIARLHTEEISFFRNQIKEDNHA